MQETQTISAIIVTYNSADIIEKCLMPLVSASSIKDIYVVDNASVDNTCTLAENKFPQVVLIKPRENIGFGRANNLALEKVVTKYALVINPDTVIEPAALNTLIAAAEKYPNAAIIAPLLVDGEGRVQESYKKDFASREKNSGEFIIPEGDICADFLLGAAWLLNMEHMKKIGFFDEKIFLYYEDDDLCCRVKRAGFDLVLTPHAKAVHLIGKSTTPSKKSDFIKQSNMAWSRLYMEKKYHGQGRAAILSLKLLGLAVLKSALYLLTLNGSKFTRHKARAYGVVRFLIGGLS